MLMLLENRMIYPAPPRSNGQWLPADLGFEEVQFASADGTRLHGWFVPHPKPAATLLFCHGNAEHVAFLAAELRWLNQTHALQVLAFDYRGYGSSEGRPSEQGILQDAVAARKWLAERSGEREESIVLMGRSLGGAVATYLAAHGSARGLILDRTFDSMPEVAATHFRWVPVRRLMRNRYPAIEWIREYDGPLLQFHGGADEIVPLLHGQRLFNACPAANKQLIIDPDLRHNDRWPSRFETKFQQFLQHHFATRNQ